MNPTKIAQSDFISVAEYARAVGLSRMAICKRIQKGRIKAIKIGRSYAIPRSYLQEDEPGKKILQLSTAASYLSVPELAQCMGITRMAVFLKIKNGEIYAQKVGRHYIIPVSKTGQPQTLEQTEVGKYKPTPKQLLSIPQIAQFIGVSRNTIFQKVKTGHIKATQVGRHYCVSMDFIQDFTGADVTKPPVKDKDYVSIADYARHKGISRIAVFKKVKRGQIPAFKIGRSYAIPIGELNK